MALNRYVLTADVTIPWSATWAEVISGGVSAEGTAGVSASPAVAQVASSAPTGGQAGVIPQATFLQGTPIMVDPAGSLYTAIGAGNLRAYVDGQDIVGHAALAN
jgi:hypothetical protein